VTYAQEFGARNWYQKLMHYAQVVLVPEASTLILSPVIGTKSSSMFGKLQQCYWFRYRKTSNRSQVSNISWVPTIQAGGLTRMF